MRRGQAEAQVPALALTSWGRSSSSSLHRWGRCRSARRAARRAECRRAGRGVVARRGAGGAGWGGGGERARGGGAALAIVGGLGRIGGDLGVARARRRSSRRPCGLHPPQKHNGGVPPIKPGNATREKAVESRQGRQRWSPNAVQTLLQASGQHRAPLRPQPLQLTPSAGCERSGHSPRRRNTTTSAAGTHTTVGRFVCASPRPPRQMRCRPRGKFYRGRRTTAPSPPTSWCFWTNPPPQTLAGRAGCSRSATSALTLLMAEEASARLSNQALMNKQGKNIRRALEIAGARAADGSTRATGSRTLTSTSCSCRCRAAHGAVGRSPPRPALQRGRQATPAVQPA